MDTLIIATQPITPTVLVLSLSCGHRLAIEGTSAQWPLGRGYTCSACQTHDPHIAAVHGSEANRSCFNLFLSCGHFCQMPYHHGLTFATVSQLINTHQYCLQCEQTRQRI